ncbi:hypothetical protein [Humibacillus xanthopallidus]|uniref:hypothetical protein n=1 Tax=Humibacillus xanthopallidus TaxID=412689 RepID=UPI00384BDFCC
MNLDQDERDLRAALSRQADTVDVSGDFAPAAIRRRRRDQRTKGVLGAVAAAAVVAVAVPTLWSAQGPGPSPAPALPTSTSLVSPSPTGSASPTTPPPTTSPPSSPTPSAGPPPTRDSDAAPETSIDLAFGPVTGSPATAYVVGGVLHDDGRTVKLPVSTDIRAVARLVDDRFVVHAPADTRSTTTWVVGSGGEIVKTLTDVQDVIASADGRRLVTVDRTGVLRLLDSSGEELESHAAGSPDTSASGIFGATVYFTRIDAGGRVSTRSWQTDTGAVADVTDGRFQSVQESVGLALLYPNQDYDPDNTCYAIFDLRTSSVRWWSCGSFAPSHFGDGGRVVVGPEVADGAGSTTFKMADVRDGRVVARVSLTDGAWSPAWSGRDGRALVLTLLDRESPGRQTLASCSTGACTIDLDAVPVSATQRDTMEWPVVLVS